MASVACRVAAFPLQCGRRPTPGRPPVPSGMKIGRAGEPRALHGTRGTMMNVRGAHLRRAIVVAGLAVSLGGAMWTIGVRPSVAESTTVTASDATPTNGCDGRPAATPDPGRATTEQGLALIVAARAGDLATVEHLLEHGASVA